MKTYGGMEIHAFLTAAPDRSNWLHNMAALPSRRELPIPIG
jgi:hypothetical protein